MGGNAIKSIDLKRINKEEYSQILIEVSIILYKKFKRFSSLKFYHTKETFGDMDIVVQKPKLERKEFLQFLEEEFKTRESYFNGDTISFEYKNFQIDLIFVPEEEFETAEFFFSFNDLNNLIGRVANRFGLKFGFNGLNYVLRKHSGNLHKRILITRNCRKIYDFLGYDYDRYLKGFETLQDIFDFVVGGKYFDPEIFSYENMNHQNRTRNAKRKTYQAFMEFLEKSNLKRNYIFKEETEYLNIIDEFFPESNLIKKLNEAEIEMELKNKLKEKFNGKLVMELIPELQGKELGFFIQNFRNSFGNFDSWLNNTTQLEINKTILVKHIMSK
jgi:hypothetical protein